MEYKLKLKIGREVSLVVCPMDDYTAEPCSGQDVKLLLSGCIREPVRKPDGNYVFTDLPGGVYKLTARSGIYLDEDMELEPEKIDNNERLTYLALKPAPSYPFGNKSTLIRMTVCDGDGKPAAASIKAVVLSEDCARAKLVNLTDEGGKPCIQTVNGAGKTIAGDEFLIKEKTEEKMEYCRIAGISRETKVYRLEKTLQFEYRPGALLLPVVNTRADSRGEAVIYFRSLRTKFCDVKLEFSYKDRTVTKEVRVEEGKTTYMGTVNIT